MGPSSLGCSNGREGDEVSGVCIDDGVIPLLEWLSLMERVSRTSHVTTPPYHVTTLPCRLPLSVQYCLVSLLRDHYPSPEVGVATSEGAAAHVIFSEWVLKFVTHECHAFCVPSRPPVHVWDTPTLPAEQIKDKVLSRMCDVNFVL